MTEDRPESTPQSQSDRIAKVMARAGVASRREAERMIVEGRVTVNGQKIDSPALDVTPADKIRVDGKPLEAPQETRLWLYYKPLGLVTTESDEKGRQTVFDALPRDLPRVMTVGRLDLNSEGLLLLTNDGELKRRLELPTTGWLRRYRVRVNGTPNDLTFAPLRRGVTIEGEEFAPMEISLDSQQGANAWLTVGIREGRNREIRRAMTHVGLIVNRLIRIGYGPFKLSGLEENEVREVKRKVLRDQLGGLLTGDTEEKPRSFRDRGAATSGNDAGPRSESGRKPYARREDGERKPFARREDGDRKPYAKREDGERKPYARREDGERKPFARREDGDRKPYAKREDGERKPYARREDGERKPFARREDGDRKPHAKREDGPRKPYARRDEGERTDRPGKPGFKGAKPAEGGRGFKPRGDRPEGGFKPRGEGKPARGPRPGGKPGPKSGPAKSGRAPGKGARPEGRGPKRG
ncbi:23S rRNA pseudouridine2605 synthase [Paracoccus aminovorans]|uniref:Pseudouridine synthase n=1 Tax=Paracoccus aminovorans TaxID=34004 RepID=A0A1I2XC50_9RHOB|nr:pseudouridine synthase [Paracoccus aminovorans]CQR85565.1 RNA pseudouridylate synthase family protein [Paracoccus aminovorans]SFH09591.1 23S rRNA pseudouridine2605 synthase [Paracoccus aminovorans]